MAVVLGRGDGAVVRGGMGSDGTIWTWTWMIIIRREEWDKKRNIGAETPITP